MDDREQLLRAIAAQEQLRGVVDDEVVDITISSLRKRLDGLRGPAHRRRQATVLFADLQGFTSLAEAMDPEGVGDLMNEVWSRLDHIITSFGGLIDKHIGDAVMALWGAELSKENDPEQAVLAGLALQLSVAEFNASAGRSLVMRVGICTGTVVLGEVATTHEFTAMGDTVNVASRLEHMAPPNGVLVAHDTYRHVRGVFDVRPLEALDVRGRTKPVSAYLVLRSKPRTFRMPTRGIDGVETRMVGRDDELEALRAGFDKVTRRRRMRTVAIVGEPGVGKSRLLYEFENWVELHAQEVFYLKARALATRQNVPYGMFRDLIASRFSILDSDSPATVAVKLRDGFAPYLSPGQADLVGHWLGFDLSSSDAVHLLHGSLGFSSTCAAHLARFLRMLAHRDPVLVVLEDLHWADADSLDLLDDLTRILSDCATFVVIATRPDLFEERPNVLSGDVPCRHLRLAPLDDNTSRAMIADILQRVSDLPETLVELIARRTEGNPFFVEELIKMLIDDDVIIPGEMSEAWRLDLDRLEPSLVPSTLTGVLEARLDGLPAASRAALQRASVVGRVFWDAVVSALEPSRTKLETAGALREACERELVYRRAHSSPTMGQEFIFKHALLRDVTYETVLIRDRKRLHALTADWLSSHAGDRFNEFLEMIADHRRLAGDSREAAQDYHTAGQRALDSGRSESARRLLELSVDMWREVATSPPAEVCLALAQACLQVGDPNAAEAAIAPLLTVELVVAQRAMALYLASGVAAERGDQDRERALLNDALPLAEDAGSSVLSRTLQGVANSQVNAGEIDKARASAARCLEVATASGNQLDRGQALKTMARVAYFAGQYNESATWLFEALALAEAIGDLELEAQTRGNLGALHHVIGDVTGSIDAYRAAEACYLSALDMSIPSGLQTVCHANLAQLYLRLGRPAETRPHLYVALRDALDAGRISELGMYLIFEADRLLQGGDVDGGLTLIGAVQSDPRVGEEASREIARILKHASLDHEIAALGMRRGRGRDFVEMCHAILSRVRFDPVT
jgi:class 3 adenylate cyclase/tetratricopeptide (TPR) repeat protein